MFDIKRKIRTNDCTSIIKVSLNRTKKDLSDNVALMELLKVVNNWQTHIRNNFTKYKMAFI